MTLAEEIRSFIETQKAQAAVLKTEIEELKKPAVKKGIITFTSTPSFADVYIDGVFTWTTTPYTVALDPKSYAVRVQTEGYYPQEILLEVEDGDVATIPFVLEKIPVEEPPVEPYFPSVPYYPGAPEISPAYPTPIIPLMAELPVYDYGKLYTEPYISPKVAGFSPPIEKELLINLETTDLMPTKGKIYSIAFLDLTTPGAQTQIAVSDNEVELIKEFLAYFEAGNFAKLVGYNTSFDYRYIFAKMMQYRLVSKAWKDIALKDVMQIMKQVKESFVFGFNRPGTLDEWGKAILGKGKYGSQDLMLKKYISGDFDYVKAFQNRQIELTRDLYNISRFVSSEAFVTPQNPIPELTSSLELPKDSVLSGNPIKKKCSNCLQENEAGEEVCIVCGTRL